MKRSLRKIVKTFQFLFIFRKFNDRFTSEHFLDAGLFLNSIISAVNKFACFKVTEKLYNAATRSAGPRRVKTAQDSQRSKVSNDVLLT
jgi:hypothetical protein